MDEIKNPSTMIEQQQRLSQSILWQLQRNFYSHHGIEAWRKGIVPHYVTSNPYIAHAYAQAILGWLRDVVDRLDPEQPVYIVELGAGSGRFAHHFLKIFFTILDDSVLHDIAVTYIMTDFQQATLDFWSQHPQLQVWIENGRLDFARFDAEQSETFTLLNGGITLSTKTLKNPLALIANYFFDGLRQDVFHIENGELYESLVTLTTEQTEPDLDKPDLIKDIELSYENRPVNSNYYDNPIFNQILNTYQATLVQTYLLFPLEALNCLERLLHLSQGELFLLTSDKGYHRERDLLFRGEPGLALHGGCFSMMVNYHAIGQYTQHQDGQFLTMHYQHSSLDICAAVFGIHPRNFPEARQAFRWALVQSSPDDFYTVKQQVEQHYADFGIAQLLAYIRLSGWDNHIFVDCFPVLLVQLPEVSSIQREDIFWMVQQVWENYYHIGEGRDLPFFIGLLLYGLDYNREAIEFFEHSLRLFRADSGTFYNLGMCHYKSGELDIAFGFMNQALEADNQFEPARVMRIQIQGELRR